MLKHALIAATLVVTALGRAPLAAAGDSDSDGGRRRSIDVLRGVDRATDQHVVHDQGHDRGHNDHRGDDGRVRDAYPPWRHRRPAAYTHPPHDQRHPGYTCRHCHFRTGSRDVFFHHVHWQHHVPWHRVGGYLAWHPLHVFFSLGGH